MAIDKRLGKKIPKQFVKDESYQRLDPGPFIGKIKNNLDPSRSGRLQVYIPDLASGDEDNEDNWRTVQYASPFLGTTTQPDTNTQNSFKKVQHSYGMWFVPPDIGNLVICIFIGGNPNRGYWFACVPNQLGHHMVPGIGGSHKVDDSSIQDQKVSSGYTTGKPTVVSEFNENALDVDWADFVNLKKPIHEEQFKVYLNQGLEEDYVRGIVSSTSQRESPSYVFGISTPGRPIKDPADDPTYASKVQSGNLKESDYAVFARKGGHVFLMDDGNFQNKDRLMRLRTAGGHQILMNDSEHILYIGNDTGSVWIELTGPGHLNIYTGKNVNIRAEGDLNFHADKSIKLNAGQDIQMSAGKNLNLQSGTVTVNSIGATTIFGGASLNLGSEGSVNVNASGITNVLGSGGVNIVGSLVKLNEGSSSTAVFSKPAPLIFNSLPDASKKNNKWVSVDGALPSIVTIAPSHEPWKLHQSTTMPGIFATKVTTPTNAVGSGESSETNEATGVTTGEPAEQDFVEELPADPNTDPGIIAALDAGPRMEVPSPVTPIEIADPATPYRLSGIGKLTPKLVTGLKTQIGKIKSGNNYKAETSKGIGKYEITGKHLAMYAYIKRDAFAAQGDAAWKITGNWNGVNGISSQDDFKNCPSIQEMVIDQILENIFSSLQRNGGIKDTDDQETQAGMIAVAYFLDANSTKIWGGADSAVIWRETNNNDAAIEYYNIGRYVVENLK